MSDTPTSGPEYSLRLSDAEVQRYRMMAEAAMKDEADIWELAGIRTGAVVADVGCGPGAMLQVLSERVGPTGSVIAIDGDVPSAAAARTLVEAAGLTNVSVRDGRADDTGLEPGSVDVVMMRHVLAHNGDAEQRIVDHVATLVRPGGAVFLVDADGLAIRIRPADPDIDDLLARYRELLARKGCDFMTGLRLDELLSAAGLEVLEFRGRYAIIDVPPGVRPPAWAARDAMLAADIATANDVARWQAAFERADTRKTKIFAPSFAAVGRRPS